MCNDPTIRNARLNLRVARGNLRRAAKAMLKTEGRAGDPLEWLSEQVDAAETALQRLLTKRSDRTRGSDG